MLLKFCEIQFIKAFKRNALLWIENLVTLRLQLRDAENFSLICCKRPNNNYSAVKTINS
jgi:hypothetical protein